MVLLTSFNYINVEFTKILWVLVYFVVQPSESRMDWYKMFGGKKNFGGIQIWLIPQKLVLSKYSTGENPAELSTNGVQKGPHWLRHRIPVAVGSVHSDIIRHCREQNCDKCHTESD